jgi:single-strand DNA-binding protein
MANFNKVILAGNLTRDPELRYSPKGTAIAKFGLAINRNWTSEGGEKKTEVTFVDVDCFGRTAENVAKYCKKGASVMLDGRLKLEEWTDKATGQKRSKLGVVVETCQFLGGKSAGADAAPKSEVSPEAQAQVPAAGADDDGVPF